LLGAFDRVNFTDCLPLDEVIVGRFIGNVFDGVKGCLDAVKLQGEVLKLVREALIVNVLPRGSSVFIVKSRGGGVISESTDVTPIASRYSCSDSRCCIELYGSQDESPAFHRIRN